jgi:RNA polymerase sigma factor (sigma-70 family)
MTNAAALTEMLALERGPLLRYLSRYLDRASAEDVAQSLYFKLQRVADHPPIDNKRAYLFRLAFNLAVDHGRAEARQLKLQEEAAGYLAGAGPQPDTVSVLVTQSELQRVAQAAMELPQQTRRIFQLNRFEGLTQREIASQLGVSATTVEKHIRRALDCLARARDGA